MLTVVYMQSPMLDFNVYKCQSLLCTHLSFPSLLPSTIHLCSSNGNQLLQLWLHICFMHVRLQAILATSKTTGVWVLM